MIEVHRVVENQAQLTSYRATQDEEKAIQLEILIDLTKPSRRHSGWHDLIATPFRYEVPVMPKFQARFKPPYSRKHVFYSSGLLETALYEYSYHMMRQRVHLQLGKLRVKNETGARTSFSVDADDSSAFKIHSLININKIMDRKNYSESHSFVLSNPDKDFIIYPSARDLKRRDSMAIMNSALLSRQPKAERQLTFFYNYKKKAVTWISEGLAIKWKDVC